MTSELPLSLIPIGSFAIAAGGLAVRFFWPSGPAKQQLIAALFIFLLLMSAGLWWQQRKEENLIREAADEIVEIIGNEKRTYEEILSGLRLPNYEVANAAIELLLHQERIGSQSATVVDKSDARSFLIRLYFVRTFSGDNKAYEAQGLFLSHADGGEDHVRISHPRPATNTEARYDARATRG